MKKSLLLLAIFTALFGAQTVFAQLLVSGRPAGPLPKVAAKLAPHAAKSRSTQGTPAYTGPVYPAPQGNAFTESGSGAGFGVETWYESTVAISANTTVYWGPTSDLSMSYGGALNLDTVTTNLSNGYIRWANGSAGSFTLTITDSTTGTPISLVSAVSLGLSANLGGLVPVTAGTHFKAAFEFEISGVAADSWWNNSAPHGSSTLLNTSFGAGYYYTYVPPSISSISNQQTTLNTGVGPLPFSVGDIELHADSLIVTATSTDTLLIPNENLVLGGSPDTNLTISLTPANGAFGVDTIQINVSDGIGSSTQSFTVTITAYDITLTKLLDADGNTATTGDQSAKNWQLSLYQDSVSPGSLLATVDSSVLYYGNLNPGTYIATEADSGSAWRRINGNLTLNDTLVVGATNHTLDTFINTKLFDVTVRKFVDTDGNLQTTGDRSAKRWGLSLYRGTVSGGTLVSSADTSLLFVANLPPGTYIATEADSGSAWKRINGNLTLNDTMIIGGSQHTADTFVNFKPYDVTLRKFIDTDGDPQTTADQTPKTWHLALYRGSVSAPNLVSGADTNSLYVSNLGPGTYIATEGDSGATWERINGNRTLNDTLTIGASLHNIDTFVNFQPNGFTVRCFEANDGKFDGNYSYTAKTWHLELHKDSPTGALVASADTSILSVSGLGNGTYVAVEADSAGWLVLGHYLNSTPYADSSTAVAMSVASGSSAGVDFYNAPPVYSQTYRSFRQDSLALDADHSGKIGKPVTTKPGSVLFTAVFPNPPAGANGLHAEFGVGLDSSHGIMVLPSATGSTNDKKLAKWDFSFASALSSSDTAFLTAYGTAGKLEKVSSYYWTVGGLQVGLKHKGATLTQNSLKLLMPNRVNALEAIYADGAFAATNGLLVGRVRADSAKYYGWVVQKKYTDVLKSLYVKKDSPPTHDGPPGGFSFLKGQGSLPKSKYNDVLFANLDALKLSIAASTLGITPAGFGELIYNDTTDNAFNGMMVKDIATVSDSLVMGYYYAATHTFAAPSVFANLNATISAIDSAFEGPVDTLSFGDSLALKGVRTLLAVPFMHANPKIAPVTAAHRAVQSLNGPSAYKLYQNYPNPFNPVTNIRFDLPFVSTVTLKIYNILGQEVATLLDHKQLAGTQSVAFSANRYGSGVYFYRITATENASPSGQTARQNFTSVMKMVLIK